MPKSEKGTATIRKVGDTVYYSFDPNNPPELTAEQRARLDALPKDDASIDYSDIPDDSDQLVWYRPGALLPPKPSKVAVKVRYDADLLEWFRSQGRGYQTRMNQVLRTYMEANR